MTLRELINKISDLISNFFEYFYDGLFILFKGEILDLELLQILLLIPFVYMSVYIFIIIINYFMSSMITDFNKFWDESKFLHLIYFILKILFFIFLIIIFSLIFS